ncbi:Hypothetical protein PHPALM_14136 [Phytophthora palmivora]|uniref:Uncharacterized protein n=1 Tax=Phytophthora palmivora TaxID=4796 RepID=A0A2P4XVJ4_9STRA|nr:Hypothetical protein PHPALM_14136 [Phytophthora palmivora]
MSTRGESKTSISVEGKSNNCNQAKGKPANHREWKTSAVVEGKLKQKEANVSNSSVEIKASISREARTKFSDHLDIGYTSAALLICSKCHADNAYCVD